MYLLPDYRTLVHTDGHSFVAEKMGKVGDTFKLEKIKETRVLFSKLIPVGATQNTQVFL